MRKRQSVLAKQFNKCECARQGDAYLIDVIRARFKITHGLESLVDREVVVEVHVREFANSLPVDVAISLYRELVKSKVDKMASV